MSCLCYFSSFNSVLKLAPNISFEPCSNLTQLVCSMNMVYNDILGILLEKDTLSSCPKGKLTTEDSVSLRGDTSAILPEGIAQFYIYYSSFR